MSFFFHWRRLSILPQHRLFGSGALWGAQAWWDIGSTEGRIERGPAVVLLNMSPLCLELYVIEEAYLNDQDNLFSHSEEGG